jgi:hypothetical protein
MGRSRDDLSSGSNEIERLQNLKTWYNIFAWRQYMNIFVLDEFIEQMNSYIWTRTYEFTLNEFI